MDVSHTLGDNPRKRLEAELKERDRLRLKVRYDYRPTLNAVSALEAEFESHGQFHWLAAALGNKYEPLKPTYDEKDPLGSYARLIEEYINPTGAISLLEHFRANRKRGQTVLPGGEMPYPCPVMTVMGTHTGWLQARSDRIQLTLAEAVALINAQLTEHRDRLKVVRLVTFKDWAYGQSSASEVGCMEDLARRINALGGMFQVISWDRSGLAESPADEVSDRSAPHWTHHVRFEDAPARPHWRVDRWR